MCPDSAKDWNYEKNHPVTPDKIVPAGATLYWWTCPDCGMDYDQHCNGRVGTSSGRCKYCKGHSVHAGNSLAAIHPEIAAQWDYSRNGTLKPTEVRPKSGLKVWWICDHERHKHDQPDGLFHYETYVSQRTRPDKPTNCPGCNNPSYAQLTGGLEYFIAQSKLVHGDRYDYSKSVYVKSHDNIEIICRIHGSFWQIAGSHKIGQGCPACNRIGHAQLTGGHEHFLKVAREVHGDKYEYLDRYDGVHDKIRIRCKVLDEKGLEHGIFIKTPHAHKAGQGCGKCNDPRYAQLHGGADYFIEQSNIIHNNKYDYSKVVYTGIHDSVEIICHEVSKYGDIHGSFFQEPNSHKNDGQGCPLCDPGHAQQLGGHEYFINEARAIHGDKYQYLDEYRGSTTKIRILCKELDDSGNIHGIFEQAPDCHKNGQGCPRCDPANAQRLGGHEYFLDKANKQHSNKFTYLDEYNGSMTKMRIYCPSTNKQGVAHGIFEQTPYQHKKSVHGCPRCLDEITISKQAQLVKDILREYGYVQDVTMKSEWSDDVNLRSNKPLRIDEYLIKEKLMIEVDGCQHFTQNGFSTDRETFINALNRDLLKDKYAIEHKVNLLRLPYDMSEEGCRLLIKQALDMINSGRRVYHTYKHFYDEIVKVFVLDPIIHPFLVINPGLTFREE
tara:strand:- start:142749 stop:144743 length:1995 start_codon:yes stop_codon:yes gene_type:complete